MNLIMSILKFVGLLVLLSLLTTYVPFGSFVSTAVVLVALWKLVNS